MKIKKMFSFRMLLPFLLSLLVYPFCLNVWGQVVDPQLKSDDSLLSKYFYLDLQSLYFPIPVSFTHQVDLSDATGEGGSPSLRFSIPVQDIGSIRIEKGHTRIDRIKVSVSQPDMDASEPPHQHLVFDSELNVRDISIIRFKVEPNHDELNSLKNTCFDKVVIGNYEVEIVSEDCFLSQRLIEDAVLN